MKKKEIKVLHPAYILAIAEEVNFRKICMGNIPPKVLYRSSHPIKEKKQEKALSILANQARISTVINLADTNSSIASKALFSPWYNQLYKDDQVIGLGMNFDFSSLSFSRKLKKGLQFIINTRPPYLIHCHAGIDRTGFVALILESFMGATIDEITDDYSLSFFSNYESSVFNEPYKSAVLVVREMLSIMSNSQEVNDTNLQWITENYLEQKIKLSSMEIEQLKMRLLGQ